MRTSAAVSSRQFLREPDGHVDGWGSACVLKRRSTSIHTSTKNKHPHTQPHWSRGADWQEFQPHRRNNTPISGTRHRTRRSRVLSEEGSKARRVLERAAFLLSSPFRGVLLCPHVACGLLGSRPKPNTRRVWLGAGDRNKEVPPGEAIRTPTVNPARV